MNWTVGALVAALVGTALCTVAGAARAARAGRAAARLVPETAPSSDRAAAVPPAPAWVARRVDATGVSWSPASVWWGWLGATTIGVVAGAAVGGPGLVVLALAAAVLVPAAAFTVWRSCGEARAETALPDALEAVARSLRSGGSLRQALSEAAARGGPLAADLTRLAAEADHGAGLEATLERWGEARPLPGVRLAVAALCLGIEAGGPQARAVDGVAATLRQRLGVAAEARALGAQARVSALVIALSPLLFCALASSTDARTARFLLHTTTGQLLLAGGVGLDMVGAVWMTNLTKVRA